MDKESARLRHRAFISYCSADVDSAERVERALRRFAWPWFKIRGRPIFRDRTGLSMSAPLWESIRLEMDRSARLVLLASPDAASSAYVERELEYWTSLSRSEPVLALVRGKLAWSNGDFAPDLTTALPRALYGTFSAEPKWIDLSIDSERNWKGIENSKFRQAVAEIVAAIDGKSLEQVLQLHARYRRILIGLVSTVTTLLLLLAVWAVSNLITSRRELADTYIVQGRYLAATHPARARLYFARAIEVSSPWWLEPWLSKDERTARSWLGEHKDSSQPLILWHGADILDATFDPSGKHVLSSSEDEYIRLWDAMTGDLLSQPIKYDSGYLRSYFTADGKFIIESKDGIELRSADDGKLLSQWKANEAPAMYRLSDIAMGLPRQNLETEIEGRMVTVRSGGRSLRVFRHQTHVAYAVLNSPGSQLITVEVPKEDWYTLHLWDVSTGAADCEAFQVANLYSEPQFSHDGRWVVAISGNRATIWDVKSCSQESEIDLGDQILMARFSPDDRLLATGGLSGLGQVWTVPDGVSVTGPLEHSKQVVSLAFNAHSDRLATGGRDGTVRIWSLTEPVVSGRLLSASNQGDRHAHDAAVNSMDFSPTGDLATAGFDGAAKIWGPVSGTLLSVWKGIGKVFSVKFSHSGCKLAIAGEDGLTIADAPSLAQPRRFGPAIEYRYAEFSPDDSMVIGAGKAGVYTFNTASGAVISHFQEHQGTVSHSTFSHDGRLVVSSGKDGTARLWKAADATEIAKISSGISQVFMSAFDRDDRHIAIARGAGGGQRGSIEIWDIGRRQLAVVSLDRNGVRAIAFSPDGSRIATAGSADRAQLWDTATGYPLGFRMPHSNVVWHVAFSPDGARLATASLDGIARIWDAETGNPLTPPLKHVAAVMFVAFSVDGSTLASATSDGQVRIWDAQIVNGSPREITLSAEVNSGLTLEPATNSIRMLSESEWHTRHDELGHLGGRAVN